MSPLGLLFPGRLDYLFAECNSVFFVKCQLFGPHADAAVHFRRCRCQLSTCAQSTPNTQFDGLPGPGTIDLDLYYHVPKTFCLLREYIHYICLCYAYHTKFIERINFPVPKTNTRQARRGARTRFSDVCVLCPFLTMTSARPRH